MCLRKAVAPIVIGVLAGGSSAQQRSPEGANLFALSSLPAKQDRDSESAIGPSFLTAHLARNGIPKLRNDPCSAPSSKVYRALSIYMLGGNTRSIPAAGSNFRLAGFRLECARREIHRSIAKRCRPCPSRRKGLRRLDERRRHPDRPLFGPCPEWGPRKHPIDSPTDKAGHRCLGRRIATPIRAATAFPPRPHTRAHPPGKPR